ncbi:hypothetical protein KIPB_006440, partial [Kipferlia bialata]|uniref:Uncharacterized protein n=1 Tax=Kipferlia bialata TaxID=797122 RepID=A0A9K3CVC7_9EUKA|eukprot:g3404.t1
MAGAKADKGGPQALLRAPYFVGAGNVYLSLVCITALAVVLLHRIVYMEDVPQPIPVLVADGSTLLLVFVLLWFHTGIVSFWICIVWSLCLSGVSLYENITKDTPCESAVPLFPPFSGSTVQPCPDIRVAEQTGHNQLIGIDDRGKVVHIYHKAGDRTRDSHPVFEMAVRGMPNPCLDDVIVKGVTRDIRNTRDSSAKGVRFQVQEYLPKKGPMLHVGGKVYFCCDYGQVFTLDLATE